MIGFFGTTLAVTAAASATMSASHYAAHYRSNATHLVWRNHSAYYRVSDDRRRTTTVESLYTWQPIEEAKQDAYNYLRRNVMAFDIPFLETMGFNDDNSTDADGLADGLIGPAIQYAIQAKIEFASTDALPLHIWREYVLNYANLNEARNDIRALLWKRLIEPLFLNNNTNANNENRTIAETVKILNTKSWKVLAAKNTKSLFFVASQTPAIFDPMSVLAFGYASCTGLAILFVQILRAAGVPARVAGTAAWHGDRTQGNHNWVEVWTGVDNDTETCKCNNYLRDCQCGWSFLEPSAGLQDVDTLDRDPCQRWFCHPARFAQTQVYAARLDGDRANYTRFPLAWEWDNEDVPAVDRTDYFRKVCSKCGQIQQSSA